MIRAMVRVLLPAHLRTLAKVNGAVTVNVNGPVSVSSVLDSLEGRYPMLRGTLRDHATGRRRPLIRYFVCARDITHDPPDAALPDVVASGTEPLRIVGAIAGG